MRRTVGCSKIRAFFLTELGVCATLVFSLDSCICLTVLIGDVFRVERRGDGELSFCGDFFTGVDAVVLVVDFTRFVDTGSFIDFSSSLLSITISCFVFFEVSFADTMGRSGDLRLRSSLTGLFPVGGGVFFDWKKERMSIGIVGRFHSLMG